jgi:PUA-domain protein
MSENYPRHFLKDKEAKALLDEASRNLKADLKQLIPEKPNIEVVRTDAVNIFLLNGKPLLAEAKGRLYPTLVFTELFSVMPRIVVDMGAVPHVCNGADIMAPGIRGFSGHFEKGDFVVIVDERHSKALAIGEALFSHEEMQRANKGIVVKNIHFVGDKTWDRTREF